MIERPDLAIDLVPVTDGTIALINLESARLQSWSRFWRAPERPGIAETIVEQELLTAQFRGDPNALDRLVTLVDALVRANPEAAQTLLIAAQSRVRAIDLPRREQVLTKQRRAEPHQIPSSAFCSVSIKRPE
jgi:negative regulator of replication initiation